MQRFILFFILIFMLSSCSEEETSSPMSNVPISGTYVEDEHFCNNYAEADAGQAYVVNGETWLWGGHREEQSFNISDWTLNINQLSSGLGRESFEALIDPEYISADNYPIQISSDSEVFWLKEEGNHKVFPLELLTAHEIINEYSSDGTPIMIAYCPLADLKIVYERTYCDEELIFALSGYVYSQEGIWEGKRGFVLWDRNTESIWWPLINRGVSQTFRNKNMKTFDESQWEIRTYQEVLSQVNSSELKVLAPDQVLDHSHNTIENMVTEVDCL